MRIALGRFIKKREDYDSENILSPIENYNRDKYLNRRIFIRILFMLIYGFGFGYMLAIKSTSIEDIKITIINFIVFYILSFYLIQIPHEFIHTLFYKSPFKNSCNSLVFFNKKRIVTTELNEDIHPTFLVISLIMPFVLFSILPLIVIINLGFDLYLYSLSFANTILSSDDLLNVILQFFAKPNENGYKRLFVIPNNYDYLTEVKSDFKSDNDIESNNKEFENTAINEEMEGKNKIEIENSIKDFMESIIEDFMENIIEDTDGDGEENIGTNSIDLGIDNIDDKQDIVISDIDTGKNTI